MNSQIAKQKYQVEKKFLSENQKGFAWYITCTYFCNNKAVIKCHSQFVSLQISIEPQQLQASIEPTVDELWPKEYHIVDLPNSVPTTTI